jgi:hypothetical protein
VGSGRGSHSTRAYHWFMTHFRLRAIDLVDVLVYLVVLGTFTQLFPAIVSESFLTSLLTAIILKLVLEVLVFAKIKILTRMKESKTPRVRAVAAFTFVLLTASGKAFILWVTDLVFGDAVYLGGFFAVTLLVVTLILARAGVRAILK